MKQFPNERFTSNLHPALIYDSENLSPEKIDLLTFFAQEEDQKEEDRFLKFLNTWFSENIRLKQIVARDFWLSYLTNALDFFKEKKKFDFIPEIQFALLKVYISIYEDSRLRTIESHLEKNLPSDAACRDLAYKIYTKATQGSKLCEFGNKIFTSDFVPIKTNTPHPSLNDDYSLVAFSSVNDFIYFLNAWFPDIEEKKIFARDFWIQNLTTAIGYFNTADDKSITHIKCILSLVYYSIYCSSDKREDSTAFPEMALPSKEECLKKNFQLLLEIELKHLTIFEMHCITKWIAVVTSDNFNNKIIIERPFLSCFCKYFTFQNNKQKSQVIDKILNACLKYHNIAKQDLIKKIIENRRNLLPNIKDTPTHFLFENDNIKNLKNDQLIYLALYQESLIRLNLILEKRKQETSPISIFGFSQEDYDFRKNIFDELIKEPINLQKFETLFEQSTTRLCQGERKDFYKGLQDVQNCLQKFVVSLGDQAITFSAGIEAAHSIFTLNSVNSM